MHPKRENHTGIGSAPDRARAMMSDVEARDPSPDSDGAESREMRSEYAGTAPPAGSIPRRGLDGSMSRAELAPLIDKLGGRLAFERTGVRLYELLIGKLEAKGGFAGGPQQRDLELLRRQELEHVHLLGHAMVELGADPTAITPSGNVQAVTGQGILAVIADPRTSFLASLESILAAELVDTESWETLIQLAEIGGHSSLAEQAKEALAVEEEHLEKVRAWLAAGEMRQRPSGHIA